MAQINARGIGRLSHIVHLEVPPGAPITLDEAFAELRTQVRAQRRSWSIRRWTPSPKAR